MKKTLGEKVQALEDQLQKYRVELKRTPAAAHSKADKLSDEFDRKIISITGRADKPWQRVAIGFGAGLIVGVVIMWF